MSEQQTPVLEPEQGAPESSPKEPKSPKGSKAPATHEEKQKRRKLIRRIVAGVVAAAIVITSVVLLRKFVFTSDDGLGEVMTAPVYIGSIQSTVSGMGNARAKNAATISPDEGRQVLDLFVAEGDYVEEGQQLYNLDDTAAQEGVRKAQEVVDDYQKELNKLDENVGNLTITAPHAGKLINVNDEIKVGTDVSAGTEVATLVNDTKLRLHLYYSWTYEGQISVGQSAQISLPAAMTEVTGRVEQVNYVRRVVPEGAVMFEVVFLLDNPGTLTDGMAASAALTTSDGGAIYPYENGTLEYYETTKITAKVSGPVQAVHLMNYAAVSAGQTLVQLGDTDNSADIANKQNSLREAQEALEEAQKKLDNYHAVAPISGTVLSCGLMLGEEVPSGGAIQIADTSTMIVDISIDERNIGYVSNGMMVDIRDMMGNYYMGIVDSVSLTAKAENGVASFPATVVVDNPDGLLMTGSYVDYTFVASQSDGCLIVPIQAVMNVTMSGGMDGEMMGGEVDAMPAGMDMAVSGGSVVIDGGGVMVDGGFGGSSMGPSAFDDAGTTTVCFVKGEPDERAIEADESWKMPEGFFAVVVETGLSDAMNVEIKSGLNEGDEVFTGYLTDSADSWG